jgi:hypothetical protein
VMTNRAALAVRENPWRADRTPWALPARNKAGRPGEEQAAERVRNPEGGTYSVRQAEVSGLARAQASKGRRTP